MDKPKDFELKSWLCNGTVCGLRVHYLQRGNDTETEWEMTRTDGETKRVNAARMKELVEVAPDHIRVMHVHKDIEREVAEWREFQKAEAADLAEYARLRAKFEGR